MFAEGVPYPLPLRAEGQVEAHVRPVVEDADHLAGLVHLHDLGGQVAGGTDQGQRAVPRHAGPAAAGDHRERLAGGLQRVQVERQGPHAGLDAAAQEADVAGGLCAERNFDERVHSGGLHCLAEFSSGSGAE